MTLRALITAAALALAGTSLLPTSSQAATVVLETVGTPAVGDSFDVRIRLDDAFAGLAPDEELLSFGFRLVYDTARLSLTQFESAAGWDDDSGWLGAGQYGASRFPGLVDTGAASVLLGTFHFEALAGGFTPLQVLTDTANLNHGLNYLWNGPVAMSASVTLAVSEVPEPATAWLSVVALGALGLGRRARWRAQPGTATLRS